MTISMYAASIPVFRQMLNSLNDILGKAEAHATEKKLDPNALLQARLFPDMFALARQVQIATDFAKGATTRLAGLPVPSYEDNEQTFADLRARVAKTLALIDGITPAQVDGSEEREIVIQAGTPRERKFAGQDYLLHYALPQFFFHVTAAYALLRHNGVEVGKRDFIGKF
jgi:uncharacterized protein